MELKIATKLMLIAVAVVLLAINLQQHLCLATIQVVTAESVTPATG